MEKRMQQGGRYGPVLLGFLAITAGIDAPSATEALAESFIQAQQFGRRDESDSKTIEFHRNVLLPQFSERYRALLRACQSALPQPDQTTFSFVAAIGSEGEVLRLWSDRSPPVYACVRGRLLFERFSPPPRAPFYLYIHMRFAQ
ncbi:MAG: hypothetical protein ACXW2G_02300 [Burkholderiaceae bacterium]